MIKFNTMGVIALAFLLSSCTYLKYSTIQAGYKQIQNAEPSQVNLKHMLSRDYFFLMGKPVDTWNQYAGNAMAIAAYSSRFKLNERVDTMFFKGGGTHYGLTLPEGEYTFLIYADLNQDGVFQATEIVGQHNTELTIDKYPNKIAKNINVKLTAHTSVSWADVIPMPDVVDSEASLFFPAGTIRSLDEPMFDQKISTMGMYDPASFLEYAATMFYALEEDMGHKMPVIFVHGIGGSPRSFKSIIERLDRTRYKPWFFYYPSGGDLNQFADFFYNLFLSGDVISTGDMPVTIIAHSMGGLVVREALNQYSGNENENKVELFVSIASPLGGHPAAASGEKHGLIVLPAWRDLNPDSSFINALYRKPLPGFISHSLFYAFRNSKVLKSGENNDGVVPLSSQLRVEAQRESSSQFGFNSSHVGVLENKEMIRELLDRLTKVKNIFPELHMNILADGGFDVVLSDEYSPITQYLISYAGKYIALLVKGKLQPIDSQQTRFIQAVRGDIFATSDLEREFRRFMEEYADIVDNESINR